MARTDAGLRQAANEIAALKKEFWNDLLLPGNTSNLNSELEHASRLADFIELGELMCRDALERKESCGGHFREEAQTAEGEAKRDDVNFCHVAAWEYQGDGKPALRHQEELKFENVKLAERNYK
jgi:succinate dehydrogenase / fumarate reductase flavoprotein subunit